jgi:hypothetical protein
LTKVFQVLRNVFLLSFKIQYLELTYLDPIEEILPKPTEDLQNILEKFSSLLDQTVYFGTHLLKWDIEKPREGKDNNIPSVFLRNIIELTDSISILIKHSSIDPAKIIFRSLIESCYGLNYMLEKNEKQRAYCFMVFKSVEKIKQCNNWISSENAHNIFTKKIKLDDLNLSLSQYFDHPDFIKVKQQRQRLLTKEEFKPIYNEYLRTKKELKNDPKWYSLFNGPKNFRELAEYLGKSLRYEIYYKIYSDNVHGTSVEKGFAHVEKDHAQIIQIRDFEDVQELFSHTISVTVELFILFIRKRIPEKEFELEKWYKQFSIPYLNITKNRLINYKK